MRMELSQDRVRWRYLEIICVLKFLILLFTLFRYQNFMRLEMSGYVREKT